MKKKGGGWKKQGGVKKKGSRVNKKVARYVRMFTVCYLGDFASMPIEQVW